MGMPSDLVLVRHGQSEANVIQKQVKTTSGLELPEGFLDRHDSDMLLTPLGIEQAQVAGEWLQQEFPEGFDHYYVSSLARTIQTAGYLALGAQWKIDPRLRERDWGEFAALTREEQVEEYARSLRLKEQNKYYWCPPGGESMGTGVQLRWDRIVNTMHREMDNQRYIGVSHGETISVARINIERLLIPEWLAEKDDPNRKMHNTQILHWTRNDPETGKDSGRLQWRRAVCPWDESKSWDKGEWQWFDIDRRFSDEQLLGMVALHEPLLGRTD